MPLKIYCGPFQPSLEKTFLDRLKELAPGLDRKVAVVCPSRRLANRLQRLICVEHEKPYLNLVFHTFYSLAMEIVEEAGVLEKTVISDGLFHDKLIDLLLRKKMGRKVLPRGLSSAYRSSIRDLVDGGLEPEALPEEYEGLLNKEGQKERLGTLVEILEEYLKRLEKAGIMPSSGLAKLAAETVESGKAESLKGYHRLIYYGFYDLTGVQADFFHAVAADHPTSLFFPYRKEHPAFKFAERLLDSAMIRTGGEHPRHLEPGVEDRALGDSLDALFDPKQQGELADKSNLQVFNVSGVRDELWRVAKEILRLRESAEYKDIGVVARTLEPYEAVVREVFKEHKIPFSMTVGEPVLRHPIAKLALTLLTLHRRQYPASAVLDILESPFFKRERFKGAAEGYRLMVHWRRIIERQGLHSGWLQWQGKIAPYAKKDYELSEDDLGNKRTLKKEDTKVLWDFMRELHTELQPSAKAQGWKKMAGKARELLESCFKVPKAMPGRLVSGAQDAWDAVLEAVTSLEVFDQAMPEALWDDFLDALEEKLNRTALESGKDNMGVRVLDAMDARGESFKHLFMIGLKEGVFPRLVREDPLLQDHIREALRDSLGYWLRPKLEGYDEEKLLFYMLASSAKERLYLVYPRSDDEGKAQVPSIYLREVLRACGTDLHTVEQVRVPRRPFDKIEELAPTHPELLSPKELSLLFARHALDAKAFYSGLKGWEEGWDAKLLSSCVGKLKELNRRGKPGGMDGIIDPPKKFMKALKEHKLSPSALQTFSDCPFKFFAGKVLGLKESDEPTGRGEMLPTMKGTLYHLVLERFYKQLPQDALNAGAHGPWKTGLKDAIDSVFDEFGWPDLGVYPLLWESSKRRVRALLTRFVPLDLESLKALELRPVFFERMMEAEVDGVPLHGKADRIDRSESKDRIRVVDYKSRRIFSGSRIARTIGKMKALQLPVYLELVCGDKTVGAQPQEVVEASFCAIEAVAEDKDWVQSFDGEQWRTARGEILSNIKKFMHHMEKGEFPMAPDEGKGGPCQWCSFNYSCRKAHGESRKRAIFSDIRDRFDKAHEVPILNARTKKPAGRKGPAKSKA